VGELVHSPFAFIYSKGLVPRLVRSVNPTANRQ